MEYGLWPLCRLRQETSKAVGMMSTSSPETWEEKVAAVVNAAHRVIETRIVFPSDKELFALRRALIDLSFVKPRIHPEDK